MRQTITRASLRRHLEFVCKTTWQGVCFSVEKKPNLSSSASKYEIILAESDYSDDWIPDTTMGDGSLCLERRNLVGASRDLER